VILVGIKENYNPGFDEEDLEKNHLNFQN